MNKNAFILSRPWHRPYSKSVGDWLEFRRLPLGIELEQIGSLQVSDPMIVYIEEAIPEPRRLCQDMQAPAWMEAFMRLDTLKAVRGCSLEHTIFFEVGKTGRLH